MVSPLKLGFPAQHFMQRKIASSQRYYELKKRASGGRKAVCSLCWFQLVIALSWRFTCKASIFFSLQWSYVLSFFFHFFSFSPAGSGYWGESAAGDGERTDSPGQGRRAGLCLAGEPQQRGSIYREPPPALQGKPHLCNEASSLHIIFAKQAQLVWGSLNVLFSCFGSDIHWLCAGVSEPLQRAGDLLQTADGALPRGQLLWDITTHVSCLTHPQIFIPTSLLLSVVYIKHQIISYYYVMWFIRLFH